jgi:hypothetical protein
MPQEIDYATLDYSQLDYSKIDSSKLDFTKMVPQEYQGKEYLKTIKDPGSFFKAFDGAQELLGKRPAGIPHDNASDDEWKAFNKSFGVPEKPEEYDLGIPAEAKVDPKLDKGVRELMQKAGLNKRQAKMISEGYRGILGDVLKEKGIAAEQADADFTKLATETFGDRKDKVLENGNKLLAKYVPEKFKAGIEKLPNEQLIVLAAALDGIVKDYISEEQLPGGQSGAAVTADQKREEARKLMASEAYNNASHPEHAATVDKVNSMYR